MGSPMASNSIGGIFFTLVLALIPNPTRALVPTFAAVSRHFCGACLPSIRLVAVGTSQVLLVGTFAAALTIACFGTGPPMGTTLRRFEAMASGLCCKYYIYMLGFVIHILGQKYGVWKLQCADLDMSTQLHRG